MSAIMLHKFVGFYWTPTIQAAWTCIASESDVLVQDKTRQVIGLVCQLTQITDYEYLTAV